MARLTSAALIINILPILDDIERARAALGDLPVDGLPRYNPGVWGAWVYAFPTQDLYDLPGLAAQPAKR